ncbi:zinc transporter 4-like [Zingiber officinale]|uniref:Uncharacterized protein n=1 Tax=Zingiber officinale TaxID=94328 RepID=A0A8J5GBZ2_ZINOF|nr:zinc transporter 4-like [Zingiber officinale]KAG6505335.1 hypothetical protein ZIOFF_037690 [Zingiber officinale]
MKLCFSFFFLLLPLGALAECECDRDVRGRDSTAALRLKFVAIASILAAGAVGVLIPILGRSVSALRPESNLFFVIKAFAAGVILATGLIHILPAAFQSLTSPCLAERPWRQFPVTGFVVMSSAIVTMMIDSFATSYYKRSHFSKARPVEEEGEETASPDQAQPFHVHGHGSSEAAAEAASLSERIRHQVISQVLELGILVHSIIIGISLGASGSPSTIRPLVGALSFHQFFEGIGLGGCIVQASFRTKSTVVMAVFFSLTAPMGIALGIAVSSIYDETSATALIVEGVFNAASAGILVYMALVDLLATDFTNPRLQSNGRLQLWCHLAVLVGAGLMSLLAKWA